MLLWLLCRPAATSPIRPLAWKPPYAAGAALEMAKRQKKKKSEKAENYNYNQIREPVKQLRDLEITKKKTLH